MNILIVGCGRVGRRLVHVLERLGHDVSVLDEDAANLALLNELEPPFSGMAVAGVPIDGDVLRSAGIEACDAVAAVTKDDNINLMVAQIARELFGVRLAIRLAVEQEHGITPKDQRTDLRIRQTMSFGDGLVNRLCARRELHAREITGLGTVFND